jgi:hypothetical protein
MRADRDWDPFRSRVRSGCAGQAQIELVAALPVLAIAAAILLQLLAVGYAQSLADGAAEAGAIATAAGRPAEPAARAAVPAWAADRTEVEQRQGRTSVRLRPPTLIPGLGRHLLVSASAWVRSPLTGTAP